MQINFNPKRLKKANKYVDLLTPKKIEKTEKIKSKKKIFLLQKIVKFLFK